MLKANVVDVGGESNDGEVEHYQDSDNADSPTDDNGVVDNDDDDDDDDEKEKKEREIP